MREKTISAFLLIMLCLYGMGIPRAQARTDAEKTIRIAIPASSSSMDDGTSAAYVGYTVEYLHEISQYTGWQYEVIEVPGTYESGLRDALAMLEAGTVDLIAPVAIDREKADERLLYSQSSFLTASIVLQIPNEVYEGSGLQKQTRVAILEGSGLQGLADAFFEEHGIAAQYMVCRTVEEQMELVCSGAADVMLNSALERVLDTSVVAEFSPQSLHFATMDSALMQTLDHVNTDIRQSNVLFTRELYEEYMIDVSQALTLEETSFIKQSEPYKVAVLDHNAPYQYVDPETGEYRGIGIDLLRYIAKSTGLQFEFVTVESWDTLLELLESGEVQIVAEVPYDYGFAADRDLTITRSYATSPYVLVAPSSFPGPSEEQHLALVEVSAYTDGYYVGDVSRYHTLEECMVAVRSGEADYTYVDLYTAQYYLGDSRYNALGFATQSYTPRSISFGLAKPTNPELLSVLNKSINRLSATDIQHIINENVNPQRDIKMFDIIIDHPVQSMVFICVVSLSIAGLLIFLLWRKEKIRKVLHKKAMEDGLTQLYNAAACRKLVTQKLKQARTEQIGAFLIMDMDNFKEINDGYGHQTGDQVLQHFAALLRDVLREDSVLARIGGDEFVAFLDSVKKEENISAICGRIRDRAHQIHAGDRPITISIGAVVVQEDDDDYDTLYRLADRALYKVKKRQKDQFCLAQREA